MDAIGNDVTSGKEMTADKLNIEELNPVSELDEILKVWEKLLESSAHSYFQSMTWVKTWLENYDIKATVRLIVAYVEHEPVLAFFIGYKQERRNYIVNSNMININATGKKYYDIIYTEYNTILSAKNSDYSIQGLVEKIFKAYKCDEIYFPRISSNAQNDRLYNLQSNKSLNYFIVTERLSSYFIDLDKIRANKDDYLALLSSNKRSQIRRSIKHIERQGKIRVESAKNVDEALSMFSSLSILHKESWASKDDLDAFTNDYFNNFHRALISNGFNKGEIQLLKVYNDCSVIGYLYNFVYNNNVLFYQSGLNYEDSNKSRPGLVSHYYSIMLNLTLNYETYDFLEGDSGYKRSLATDETEMYDVVVQKKKMIFRLENHIKNIIKKYKIRLNNS